MKALVVDANCILQAVLGSRASEVFRCLESRVRFHTALPVFAEVLEYIPILSEKKSMGLNDLFVALQMLPLEIHELHFYQQEYEEARKRIGKRDPDDVPLLALAMKLQCPIWTNDKDFQIESVKSVVKVFDTASLIFSSEV